MFDQPFLPRIFPSNLTADTSRKYLSPGRSGIKNGNLPLAIWQRGFFPNRHRGGSRIPRGVAGYFGIKVEHQSFSRCCFPSLPLWVPNGHPEGRRHASIARSFITLTERTGRPSGNLDVTFTILNIFCPIHCPPKRGRYGSNISCGTLPIDQIDN